MHFSRRFLVIVFCLAVMGVAAAPFLISNYRQLKISQPPNSRDLARIVHIQKKEIQQQAAQLKRFQTDVMKLKTALTQIKGLEQEVLLIANIGDRNQESSIFGVGGSIGGDADSILGYSDGYQNREKRLQMDKAHANPGFSIQSGDIEFLGKKVGKRRNLLVSTPIIYPAIGWETSGFGYQHSPFTGHREFHKGLDIAAAIGTPVVAPANGVVTFAGPKGFWGQALVVEHGHGLVTRYYHLSEVLKAEGARVTRGETIARVGNTGRSMGPHLHYEVRLNGIPVNPKKYIMFAPSYIHEAFKRDSGEKNTEFVSAHRVDS